MNYHIVRLNQKQYYLVCMSNDSILSFSEELENEPIIKSNEGELIVDQLLLAGVGKNRFISCKFCHGKVNFDTAKTVEATKTYDFLSSKVFSQYLDLLRYSILTDSQLELIEKRSAI